MSDHAPLSLLVEMIGFAFLIMIAIRYWRMNKKRPLQVVMSSHGMSEKDIEKIPEKTRKSWTHGGVSQQEFTEQYRFHVENQI